MNHVVEESMLNAYVDDELANEDRKHVEAALRANPQLREREARLREVDSCLRDALRPALVGPMPALTLPAHARPGSWLTAWLAGSTRVFSPALVASAAFVAGGVAGALIFGSHIGLAPPVGNEVVLHADTLQRTLEVEPSGTTVTWRNPDISAFGEITPVRTYRNRAQQYCREFSERRAQPGTQVVSYGVACREPDGAWRVRIRYYH